MRSIDRLYECAAHLTSALLLVVFILNMIYMFWKPIALLEVASWMFIPIMLIGIFFSWLVNIVPHASSFNNVKWICIALSCFNLMLFSFTIWLIVIISEDSLKEFYWLGIVTVVFNCLFVSSLCNYLIQCKRYLLSVGYLPM